MNIFHLGSGFLQFFEKTGPFPKALVGHAGIHSFDGYRITKEYKWIGWEIRFDHRNKGLIREAAKAFIPWWKQHLEQPELWGWIWKTNEASIHADRAIGFEFVREDDQYHFVKI